MTPAQEISASGQIQDSPFFFGDPEGPLAPLLKHSADNPEVGYQVLLFQWT